MIRRPLILLLALGLMACGSTPPAIHYYSLTQGAGTTASGGVPQHELRFAPLVLSDQIDSINLVYELQGQELQFAERHRWAGTLDNQLEQLTQEGLSARLPGWVVREEGGEGNRLAIRIQQFGGRFDGKAVVSGRWRLTAPDGKVLLERPFREERTLPADGYNALVGELSLGWGKVLDGIAHEVARH